MSNRQKMVVVVEDEPDIKEVIEYNLQREGYRVLSALDGEVGLKLIQKELPDLVLLDLMLPGLDGIEICRRLRSQTATKNIPIIMVTAKGDEADIVLGLGVGADDYVTKPFSAKELVARVKAVLRRMSAGADYEKQAIIRFDGVTVDANRHQVKIDGKDVDFTATEFRLLNFLASHPGRVYTREQLLKHVVGENTFVVERNIDVHVRVVRKKLGPYRDHIKTVRGVGYRFRDVGE